MDFDLLNEDFWADALQHGKNRCKMRVDFGRNIMKEPPSWFQKK